MGDPPFTAFEVISSADPLGLKQKKKLYIKPIFFFK